MRAKKIVKRCLFHSLTLSACLCGSSVLFADAAPNLNEPAVLAAISAAVQEQKAQQAQGRGLTPPATETNTNSEATPTPTPNTNAETEAETASAAPNASPNLETEPNAPVDDSPTAPPPIAANPPAEMMRDDMPPPVMSDSSRPVEPLQPSTRLWNLQDADILSVINEVSQETGKNFVVDPRVTGKISLVSSKPLRKGEVYNVFLSVLELLGYSAIPSGNVIKIVPNMESGEMATRVASKQSPGRGDEVVVRVIPLNNVTATQLIPVLRPMMPQWSNISAYTPGNVLILLGRAENLKRIAQIIQDVDQASNNGIQIIPLQHASAVQVAQVLNNLQAASRAAGETASVSIAVDDRSNSLLLSGPKGMRIRMRVLIAQLDAPAATPAGNTEVIYLKYLESKTFAPLLGKIAQNIVGKGGSDNSAPAAASSAAAGAAGGKTTASKDLPENTTNIQAEPSSNAIIITAPPALMRALKIIVSKLDIRPAQVLVEAIIVEIDETNLTALGIQWGSIASNGAVQPTVNGLATSFPPFGAGVVGLIPGTDITAILTALQNQSGVDILSTPTIMVLDNQKATIEVGQDVPVQTGSYQPTGTANAAGTPTPFTTIDRKPVTLKLDVTPQLNLGNSVRLKLDLKNDTLRNPQNPGLTPIINTSKITNSVLINTNDILVLGGLISNANIESVNKVPILGDLPIIGTLFRQKTSDQQKKNLMIFIKPVIMHNESEAMMITQDKYDNTRSTQANFRNELEDVGKEPLTTLLPPWKNKKDLPTPFDETSS